MMTNKEAIRLIRNLPTMCEFTDAYGEPIDSDAYYEAVDMAISALQAQDLQPTCNQLATNIISRQEAIDALKGLPTWWADEGGYYGGAQPPMVALLDPEDAVSAIENLPSAQPEIIHCKDCKHFGVDRYNKLTWCSKINYGYGYQADDFCSKAERRTNGV